MHRLAAAVFCATLLAAAAPAQTHSPELYVSGFFSSSVQRFHGPLDAATGPHPSATHGAAVYAAGVARRPWGLAFGPDGNLYVANEQGGTGGAIARVTGPFSASPGTATVFVDAGAYDDVTFGPDGHLYAAGHGAVDRYDIVTGQRIDAFTKGHALDEVRGIAFGPDGDLYVAHVNSCVTGPNGCNGTLGEIDRFDGRSGQFRGVFVPKGRGGLTAPWKVAFGFHGELFVADESRVLRFQGPYARNPGFPWRDGALFASRDGLAPLYLAVGPDRNLYVSTADGSGSAGSVLRFDGESGAFLDVFVANVDGGPRGLAFAIGAR